MEREYPKPPLWLVIVDYGALGTLSLTALLSFGLLALRCIKKHREGRLRLPDHTDRSTTKQEDFQNLLLSHVDASMKSDGDPTNLKAFWRSVVWRRIVVLLLSLAGLGVQIYRDVIYIPHSAPKDLAKLIIDTVICAYLCGIGCFYVFTKRVPLHYALTAHLCAVSTIHVTTWYIFTLGKALSMLPSAPPHWSEYACAVLSFLQLIVGILVPLGPDLYQDPHKLFNAAVSAKLKEKHLEYVPNVIKNVSSSIFGKITFHFVFPMISKTASMEQVDVDDLPVLNADLRTQNILPGVTRVRVPGWVKNWGPTWELNYVVWAPQAAGLLKYVLYTFLIVPLWYLPHWCLQQMLFVLDEGLPRSYAFAFGVVLVLGRVGSMVLQLQQFNIATYYAEPRISAHTAFLLYQKLLTRNTLAAPVATDPKSKEKVVATKADILNLISSDSSRLAALGWTFVSTVETALEMFLGCFYVWALLGTSGFWGLSTILLTCPPAYLITKWEYKVFEKRLELKDQKITLMQEAIQAISMIKMMAAERFWFKRIKDVRDKEFTRWIQARLLGNLSGLLYAASPVIVVIVSFAHYTLIAKKEMTASVAFTAIAVFSELRPVLLSLPMNMAQILQEILSAKRIGTFLRNRDVDYLEGTSTSCASAHLGDDSTPDTEEERDLYIMGTVGWDIDQPQAVQNTPGAGSVVNTPAVKFRLHDLNVHFPRGEITLVAGKFGSGKTLLLLALLGEAKLLSGKINYAVSPIMNPLKAASVDVRGLTKRGVAYVPQTPWLQSLSIRDNILFGLPMDLSRYRSVLFATGLLPDLEVLEDADLTEIGERGKILSGGQKARVSLARAVYARATTLILDDVISAVDAETSQHIVKHCFRGPLMAGRTVIIASHAVEALAPLAHRAIFLDDGQVIWSGKGPDLLTSQHMSHLQAAGHTVPAEDNTTVAVRERKQSLAAGDAQSPFNVKEAVPKTPRQLIIDENRAKGQVDFKHWKDLMRFNGNGGFWAGMIGLVIVGCLAPVAQRGVLRLWTSQDLNEVLPVSSTMQWVTLYAAIALGTVLLDSVAGLYRFWGGITACKSIHAIMLESMLRARMLFFTKTRAGSIVQRFGTDLDDTVECSELLAEMFEISLNVVISMASVTYYGGWLFFVISASLLIAIWKPGQWYRSASRQVRRLQSVIPGPINAIYGETVAGTAVIRAFGQQSMFMQELMRSINMRIAARAWASYVQRWLYVNLRIMDVVIVFTAIALILVQPNMTGATAGFVMGFARTITINVNWVLINLRTFELKGVSLERTAEYRALEKEDTYSLQDTQPAHDHDNDYESQSGAYRDTPAVPRSWPTSGAISVRDLSARYGPDLPDILHGVTFDVTSGERVGIVGATGGGKSTLAKAFFSFVDITGGRIEIDGVDIAQVPLGRVRSSLGIIAQDPILLSGSLRLNLDLEGKYDDAQLYEALRQVQLLKPDEMTRPPTPESDTTDCTAVSGAGGASDVDGQTNIFQNLDYEIKSGGENLSAGQKQLVVLARALLRKHKILILDEATASIDSATDREISRVVHEEFRGATVLIIAHRLRTIMPCSKILVMDKGEVVQQGTPLELIKQHGGKFASLCMAGGTDEYSALLGLAEEAEAERRRVPEGQLI